MRLSLVIVLSAVSIACTGSREQHRHGDGNHAPHHQHTGDVHHRFEDAERWAKVFEAPERDAWQKPEEVISVMNVPHGGRLADIGAATGYFPVRIARARPDVTVYGVDLEADMVRFLEERARREALPNLQAVQGTASDPKIPEPVDVALLVNTYHHIENRAEYFSRLSGSLRPGGRVAIVDFKPESDMGPKHKLPRDQVVKEMGEAGYRLAKEHGFLPEQYFLEFERAE